MVVGGRLLRGSVLFKLLLIVVGRLLSFGVRIVVEFCCKDLFIRFLILLMMFWIGSVELDLVVLFSEFLIVFGRLLIFGGMMDFVLLLGILLIVSVFLIRFGRLFESDGRFIELLLLVVLLIVFFIIVGKDCVRLGVILVGFRFVVFVMELRMILGSWLRGVGMMELGVEIFGV